MTERRALQIAVIAAALVPLSAGTAGVLAGVSWLDAIPSVDAQSHARYLSGLLLGIGIAFVISVPTIETAGPRFRLLGGIIVLGGLARLGSLIVDGPPSPGHVFGLVMELMIVPALVAWQTRVAQEVGAPSTGTVGR